MKYLIVVIASLVIVAEASAQSFYNYKRGRDMIVSVGTGTATYFGDLKDQGDYFDPKAHINLGLSYYFNPRFGIRSEVQWFQLEGADEDSDESGKIRRNLSFASNNFELNAVGIVQAFPDGRRYYQRANFNVYAFAGIALLYFNPTAELNGTKYALQPIRTEGVDYSRLTVAIPYGIGIKYKINPFFNLVVEGGFRQTFTDYLDDVSTVYIDNSSFSDPIHATLADRRPEIDLPVQEAGNKRGNPDRNDNYFLLNLKIEYYLPADLFSTSKIKSKRHSPRKGRRR